MTTETVVPPDLAVRFEELVEKIVQTFRYSADFKTGPQMTVQIIMLTMVRLGHISNPDILVKLQAALDVAWQQYQDETT